MTVTTALALADDIARAYDREDADRDREARIARNGREGVK